MINYSMYYYKDDKLMFGQTGPLSDKGDIKLEVKDYDRVEISWEVVNGDDSNNELRPD